MAAMEELVNQGKVRYLGVSNFSIEEMERAQAALRKQRLVSNQLRYSLIERTIEPRILPYCQQHQITVLAYSPLGHAFRENDRGGFRRCSGCVAKAVGKTRAQVALNWCIASPVLSLSRRLNRKGTWSRTARVPAGRLTEEHVRILDESIRFRRRSRPEAA